MADNKNVPPNRGYLYPAEKKKEKSPDFRGKGRLSPLEMWVSGWWENSEENKMSLSFTDPNAFKNPSPAPKVAGEGRGHLEINARKSKPNEPDFRGEGLQQSKRMVLAGWWKEKEGVRFISLAFYDPDAPESRSTPAQAPAVPVQSPAPAPVQAPAAPADANNLDPLDLGDIFPT